LSLPPIDSNEAASVVAVDTSGEDSLRRYRGLQWVSICMIAAGLAVPAVVVFLNPGLLGVSTTEDVERLLGPILVAAGFLLVLTIGLLLNAVRAVIVRGGLPAARYRGPAIFTLLLLALIIGNVVGLAAGADAVALLTGGELTVAGSLILVTAAQTGMLIVVGGLIVAPGALDGLRLAPRGKVARGILIGLGLAIPAWIGATLVAGLVELALKALGITPDPGPIDQLVNRADPTVLLIGVVLVAPIAEEVFFRGVVFNAWEREHGTRLAVYGSALLFASIHGALLFAPVLLLGIALAHVYRITRSLPTTMAMHAAFNGISLALALLVRLRILDIPV
jgi:membrane protease YdiL (CAAX protease family)